MRSRRSTSVVTAWRSLHRHARLRAGIGIEQVQRAAVETGGQDHAFAEAEAHLARRQVGDGHPVAAAPLFRLSVAGADSGEDTVGSEEGVVGNEVVRTGRYRGWC